MNILVLGGGQMGTVVATDLAQRHHVTVADIEEEPEGRRPFAWTRMNASHPPDLIDELRSNRPDLIVCALPGNIGYGAVKTVIEQGINCIDISFAPEDTFDLSVLAQNNQCSVVYDCGFAPGLPNLIVGHALRTKAMGLRDVRIYVGGMARNSAINPYGYVCTWSLDDLYDEFIRPARFKVGGELHHARPMVAPIEIVQVGPFHFESFISDGLRSLLNLKGIDNIVERTLRWPGHIAQVNNMLGNKSVFVTTIRKHCSEGEDMVVMRVDIDGITTTMQMYPKDGLTAMARATALTCAATAEVASMTRLPKGVMSLEDFGMRTGLFDIMMKELSKRNINFYSTPRL
jgi:saccharopine dehydrogenase-like NADP-dependent oxidoreductase